MYGSLTLEWLIFPFGVFFLLLHAGPLLRVAHRPSIHGGTRWWFFSLEIVLSLAWIIGSPSVWGSALGRSSVATHLTLHVGFAVADWFAHDILLAMALVTRRQSPLLWAGGQIGLIADTASHAIVVGLVALALPWPEVVILCVPAILAYRAMTRSYIRRFR